MSGKKCNSFIKRTIIASLGTLAVAAVYFIISTAVDASAHQARTSDTRRRVEDNERDIAQHQEQMRAITETLTEIKVTQAVIKETVERIDRRTSPPR